MLLCLLAVLGILSRASAQDLIPASPDFPVTGDITADQSDPVLLTTPSDGFVAVWRSGALGEGLRGRVYDHTANPVGAESSFDGLNGPLAAAGRSEAGFIVVGTRYSPDGPGGFGQGYDWAAQAVWAAPIPIADVEPARFPAIAMAADGSFLVAWIGDLASETTSFSPESDIFARAFRHDDTATGPGVRLNEAVHNYQGLPSVALGSDGNYLVVWSAAPEGSEDSLLFARIVGPEGRMLGSPLQIETETRLYSRPHVVRVATGFVVAWTGAPERNGVFGRLLTAEGAPIASEFRIDAGSPGYASTGLGGFASLGDGFRALWNVSEWGIRRHTIYAQRFDSAGGRIGAAIRVNSEELRSTAKLAAATDSTGGFVAAWQKNDRYPLPDAIIARRFVICGDGVLRGEACDDENVADGDGCDSNCTATACGNSVQTLGEDCDDGNLIEGDGCSSDCRIKATFTPTTTPTPTVTPTPRSFFNIEGCVEHFSGCGGSVEYGMVHLSPLDRTARADMGYFSFEDVPPGDYTLTYSPRCNPAGCTRPVDVQIVDTDGYAAFYRYLCPGDCSIDDKVTVDEIVSCVNDALGLLTAWCFCDADHSGEVTVDDLVKVVDNALGGCR